MHINALTLLLLNLARQGGGKTDPASGKQGGGGVRNTATPAGKAPEIPDTGLLPERSSAPKTKPASEPPVPPPALTPLPLRSALFPEARFYAGAEDEKQGAGASAKSRPVSELFICLVTQNLGNIWIMLSCRQDSLHVKYFTGDQAVSKMFRENFPPLRAVLKEAGFKEVSLSTQTRAKLATVGEELLPRLERHLLDHRI